MARQIPEKQNAKKSRPGSKREIVTFRMDLDSLKRLHKVSDALKSPPGELIREWVIERTQQELSRLQIDRQNKGRNIPTKLSAQQASAILSSMISQTADEQSWEDLKRALDEDRLSTRKFFP